MPLRKSSSQKAFNQNMRTEVKAKKAEGYSPAKAAQIASAISYSVKRKAQGKAWHHPDNLNKK